MQFRFPHVARRAASPRACAFSASSVSRRNLAKLLLVASFGSVASSLLAEEVAVPVALQIELLLKVAQYDKNLRKRTRDRVRVVVVVKADDADSTRTATQATKALSTTEKLIGLPLEAQSATFSDAASLALFIREQGVAIIYVTAGFAEQELAAIGQALDGISVLSAGTAAKYVGQGVVLGFDLAGGKPKLVFHLSQARKQHVQLSTDVLRLMKVIP
jgi:hypothetical protein